MGGDAEVTIRACRQKDVACIRRILEESPEAAAWPSSALEDSLIRDGEYFLVAEAEEGRARRQEWSGPDATRDDPALKQEPKTHPQTPPFEAPSETVKHLAECRASRREWSGPHTTRGSPALQELVGFVVGKWAKEEAEILNLAVRRDCRREGMGRALVAELLARFGRAGVRSVFLEVRESNQRAREFYEALGFVVTGRREKYYRGPEEAAVVMGRQLIAGG